MAYDLIPRSFLRFPSLLDEDSDLWPQSSVQTSSSVSISEDEKTVLVTVAVPGLEEKDIEVTFDKGVLWVKGEKSESEEDKKRKFYRRSASSYSYRVAVPGEIDLAKEPQALYKNGVMSVSFPKSPQSQPKKIAVKAQN